MAIGVIRIVYYAIIRQNREQRPSYENERILKYI